MAQLVKGPTLDFDSGRDLKFAGLSPTSGSALTAGLNKPGPVSLSQRAGWSGVSQGPATGRPFKFKLIQSHKEFNSSTLLATHA